MFPSQIKENNTRTNEVEDAALRRLTERAADCGYACSLNWHTLLAGAKVNCWGCVCIMFDFLIRSIRLDPGTTKDGAGEEVYMTEAVYRLLAADR